MIKFLLKTIGQLLDPALRRVMYFSVLGSVIVFTVIAIGLFYLLSQISAESIPYLASILDYLGISFEWISGLLFASGIGFLTMLLFPGLVIIVVGFFLEDAAKAVEAKHFPDLPKGRAQPAREIFKSTLRFACLVSLVNTIALPFYIVLFFIPPLNLILFYIVNGYLTGREYFELVSNLRLDPNETEQLRKRHRGRIQLAGVLLFFIMTIPVVNLLAPVIATAFMVHFFHSVDS